MKTNRTLSLLTACLLAIPAAGMAAEKKTKAAPPAGATAPEKPAVKGPKALPMNVRADMIDASAKTFTLKRKDGVEVKHSVTAKTEIMQNGEPAKFADIKAGDVVSGLRLKKGDAEYEVVKITKFGPKGPAAPKADKPLKVKRGAPVGEVKSAPKGGE